MHRLIKRNRWRRFAPAKLHQHRIDRDTIQPRRKCSISAERTDRAEHLQESLLSQIFCFSDIFRHEQAHRINAILVLLKQCGKGLLVARLRALYQADLDSSRPFADRRSRG